MTENAVNGSASPVPEQLRLTELRLRNWRNFPKASLSLPVRAVLVGPNASGKSNLLDAIRFLRDVAGVGGGLAAAVERRGGIARIRSLAARKYPDIQIGVSLGTDEEPTRWSYDLVFGRDKRHGPIVKEEVVRGPDGKAIIKRPLEEEQDTPLLLSQTALEQVTSNQQFRPVVDFLAGVRYLHLVPQLVRDPDRSVHHPNDPFGGDFLHQLAQANKKTRDRRLRHINKALKVAVPQLEELELFQEEDTGRWHLRGKYLHWRAPGAWQDESDFSDGTLRLIGLLWSVLADDGLLLLEEPELSLHPAVVRFIPSLIASAQRASGRQVILSTHSSDLLLDEGLGLDEVLMLVPGDEGTTVEPLSRVEDAGLLLDTGTPISDIVKAGTRPRDLSRITLFDQ